MAPRLRSPTLETRSVRLRLRVRRRPYFVAVSRGVSLGYRRNLGPGTWLVRCADGAGSSWSQGFATADDFEDANAAGRVLDFWTAQTRARELVRGKAADTDKPATLAQSLDDYERDLAHRGGGVAHVQRLRRLLSPALLARPVGTLTMRELRRWRDLRLASVAAATVTREVKSFKAALNHTAALDPSITNKSAWTSGLASLPDSHVARTVAPLSDEEVRAIVVACYAYSHQLGLFVEVLATCGCRPIQALRLVTADLDVDRLILTMPRSAKGKGQKKTERRPIPVPLALAAKLQAAATGRLPRDPLLQVSDYGTHFDRALAGARLPRVIPYVLRHTSICKALMRGVPVRVVCDWHDTSETMLRRTYAKFIADYSDQAIRAAQIDFAASPSAEVVVPLTPRRAS